MPIALSSLLSTALVAGAPRTTAVAAPVVMMAADAKAPNWAINAAGKAMPLLSPIFNVEADLQALATNLGSYGARTMLQVDDLLAAVLITRGSA